MSLPTLHTKRLILRPWHQSDLGPFAEFNADPRVMEFYPNILTREESDALAEKMQKEFAMRGYGFWAVEVPGIASFIGYIGLNYWDLKMEFSPCIDIGWRLGFAYWGKGYATEGALGALEYGFKSLKFAEIVSMATIGNTRSHHVMKRLGMKTNAAENFQHPKLPKDHPLSWRVLYRLASKEWDNLHKIRNLQITTLVE